MPFSSGLFLVPTSPEMASCALSSRPSSIGSTTNLTHSQSGQKRRGGGEILLIKGGTLAANHFLCRQKPEQKKETEYPRRKLLLPPVCHLACQRFCLEFHCVGPPASLRTRSCSDFVAGKWSRGQLKLPSLTRHPSGMENKRHTTR
jgi:hypothetical protein